MQGVSGVEDVFSLVTCILEWFYLARSVKQQQYLII